MHYNSSVILRFKVFLIRTQNNSFYNALFQTRDAITGSVFVVKGFDNYY